LFAVPVGTHIRSGRRVIVGGSLDGTAALVTGASSGIDAATARQLAGHGAATALVARRAELLEGLRSEIRDRGGRALIVQTDITDRAQAAGAVERTVMEWGRLDTVVNNAGIMLNGPVEDAPLEDWERMVSLNVLGLLYITQAALPHLLCAAEGEPRQVADLVNVSSVAGRVARRGSAVYNLTKFGVNAFSESMRQEVTTRHVRVSLVEPGAVRTELLVHMRPEVRKYYEEILAGVEQLEAGDIADAIEYIVTRPRRVAVNEIMVRPTEQER
jgi:NADP-dependent 3-hydroxy acid dehydrogenase YdfG